MRILSSIVQEPWSQRLWRVFVIGQILILTVMAIDWLCIMTSRFYLEDRTDAPGRGTVWQRFDVEKGQVVPRIVTSHDAHFEFLIDFLRPYSLKFTALPNGKASYAIYRRDIGGRKLLEKREFEETLESVLSVPSGRSTLEFESQGSLTWLDLRVERKFLGRYYLIAFAIPFLFYPFLGKNRFIIPPTFVRLLLVIGSTALVIFLFELAMSFLGERMPYAFVAGRHDLGTARLDPRWEHSARYKIRLKPNSQTVTQRKYGDIVQRGVIPPEVSPTTLSSQNSYRVHIDGEGFRNEQTREKVQIAALGDSFTDALQLPAEYSWPARLEHHLGQMVQNYGVAGFGPQQELYVLQDYAIQHRPKIVVLAFFAGNDIYDAENFERFKKNPLAEKAELPGWKIKKRFTRYETFYSFTIAHAALELWNKPDLVMGQAASQEPSLGLADTGEGDLPLFAFSPSFDRGMFTIPVNGRTLRFALMPPYLNMLRWDKKEFESKGGWKITRNTLLEMKRICDEQRAQLVVLFIPFKSQVYWPLLLKHFNSADLSKDLRFYFPENPSGVNVKQMSSNRQVLNSLMSDFCQDAGIAFLDLTPALQQEVERGHNMYFPDDAHWNAAGQELAARELAEFLKTHRLTGKTNP